MGCRFFKIFLLILLGVPYFSILCESQEFNMIKNGNFENRLADWQKTGNVKIIEDVSSGEKSAELLLTESSGYEILSQTVSGIQGNRSYYLEGWIKSSGGFCALLSVIWIGNDKMEETVIWFTYEDTKDYIMVIKSIPAPSYAKSARIKIQAQWGYMPPNSNMSYNMQIKNFKFIDISDIQ